MIQEKLILQQSPRIDIDFYAQEFEIKTTNNVLVPRTVYQSIQNIELEKGNIPWFTGLLTMVVDLVTSHGIGSWKREKGKLKIKANSENYVVQFKLYDREQTALAIKKLKERIK